ncbi:hypothetical protein ES703_01378 [subsurface metagenome]
MLHLVNSLVCQLLLSFFIGCHVGMEQVLEDDSVLMLNAPVKRPGCLVLATASYILHSFPLCLLGKVLKTTVV